MGKSSSTSLERKHLETALLNWFKSRAWIWDFVCYSPQMNSCKDIVSFYPPNKQSMKSKDGACSFTPSHNEKLARSQQWYYTFLPALDEMLSRKNKNNSVKYEWYELLSIDSSDDYIWKSPIDWHTVLLRKHLVCLIQLIGRIHQISKLKEKNMNEIDVKLSYFKKGH